MSDIKPRVDSSGVGWCDPGCPQANGYACRIDNAVRWHNGGLDDDACPHHARRVAAERDRLREWARSAVGCLELARDDERRTDGLSEFTVNWVEEQITTYPPEADEEVTP